MANEEHLNLLRQGSEVWNKWREENKSVKPDLSGATLSEANLSKANLSKADLSWATLSGADLSKADLSWADLSDANLIGADLSEANLMKANLIEADLIEADLIEADLSEATLIEADLSEANLSRANLSGAYLSEAVLIGAYLSEANLIEADLIGTYLNGADLSGADLSGASLMKADLSEANLSGADLSRANLSGANLKSAVLVKTNFTQANLSGCHIFGISAWKLKLEGAIQSDLVISDRGEPVITVDNLEIAQFIYLLIHNEKLRDVIDTIGKKSVLILGRFTPERKAVLDALREELRKRNYIPILFDFADITNAKSIPQELQAIIPNLPSVAVQPIIHIDDYEYAMFEHFKRYPWVLPVYRYEDQKQLIAALSEKVIEPAEKKVDEMRPKPRS